MLIQWPNEYFNNVKYPKCNLNAQHDSNLSKETTIALIKTSISLGNNSVDQKIIDVMTKI